MYSTPFYKHADLNEDQKAFFDSIVAGSRTVVKYPIPQGWYKVKFDRQGNKLVSFATKVTLDRGSVDKYDEKYQYVKNLEFIIKKAPTLADVTSCSEDRRGYCITHITAKHAKDPELAFLVKKIFTKSHPRGVWNKISGMPNHTGKTAGNHARGAHENVQALYAKQKTSNHALHKMARNQGLKKSNLLRIGQQAMLSAARGNTRSPRSTSRNTAFNGGRGRSSRSQSRNSVGPGLRRSMSTNSTSASRNTTSSSRGISNTQMKDIIKMLDTLSVPEKEKLLKKLTNRM